MLEVAVSDLLVELRVLLLRVYDNYIRLDNLIVSLVLANSEDVVGLLDAESVK